MSIEKFIGQVTRDDENTVTAFLYSLMDVAYVRTIILRALLPDNIPYQIVEGIEFPHISTQKRVDGVGQPDVCIENDECFFIIEIKIANSTGFQQSQLTAYPEKVHEKAQEYKGLIYLLPDSYRYEKQPGEDRISISVVRWSNFIREMEVSEIASDNPIMHQFLNYLKNRLSLSTASFERGDIITMFSPQKVFEVLKFQKEWKSFIGDVDTYLKDDKELAETYVQSTWSDWGDYALGTFASNQTVTDVFWFGYDPRRSFEETSAFCCVKKSLVDEKNPQKKPLGEQEIYVVVTMDSLKMNGYLQSDDPEWVYFPIDSAFLYSEKMDENIKSFADTVKKLILEFSK
jgi:hypothetical protein